MTLISDRPLSAMAPAGDYRRRAVRAAAMGYGVDRFGTRHVSVTGLALIAVAAHLDGAVAGSADSAFVDGVHVALYVAVGAAAVTASVVAALLPRHDDVAHDHAAAPAAHDRAMERTTV